MASIDVLFQEIIHYEKTAQERKNLLHELRQAVFSAQEKGKALEKNYLELTKKLANKVEELSDRELMCKWLSCQETIFREQQADLEKQLGNLTEKQEFVLKKLQDEKEEFCTKISLFVTHFGPGNSGSTEREQSYTSQLKGLLQEKEHLKASLENYNTRENAVSKLCIEKENLQAQLRKVMLENKRLTSSLCVELQRSTDLEEEKQSITDVPTADKEFTNIQEQLEGERQVSVDLAEQYNQVQSQLHQLHQKLWQQQLKQQQQVRKQQQQPLQQQTHVKRQQMANKQPQHLSNQQSVRDDMEGSPSLSSYPSPWQQRGDLLSVRQKEQHGSVYGQTMKFQGQKSNTRQTMPESEAARTSGQTVSQETSETDNCLEVYSDLVFSDSDDLSGADQEYS